MPDITEKDVEKHLTYTEVKNGYVRYTKAVRDQVIKDVALRETENVKAVRWVFMMKDDGSLAADPRLIQLLQDSDIPYEILVP